MKSRLVIMILLIANGAGIAEAASVRQASSGQRASAEARHSSARFDLGKAQKLAARWGVVSSLIRTREHNRAVGGAPNSFHLVGRALDLARRAGVRHADVEAALIKAGFRLLESLDEGDHSHFAFGGVNEFAPRRDGSAPSVVEAPPPLPACPSVSEVLVVPPWRKREDRTDSCAPKEGSAVGDNRVRLLADERAGKLVGVPAFQVPERRAIANK